MAQQGTKSFKKQYLFTGEWIPEEDPLKIGEVNFSELQNCRYKDAGIEGVLGYTKINTTAMNDKVGGVAGGYYRGRSGIQLLSPYSGESRVLVQIEDATLANSAVAENKASVSAQGDFETAVVHTDDTSAALGRFSKWPGGNVAYSNGIELMIYAGGEMRCAGFVNYAPDDDFKYNYTEVIQNEESDSANIATLKNVTESVDANTLLLMHLDNAITDSSATPHVPVNVGAFPYDAAIKVFGTHSANLEGVNDYITVPDHADFNFAAGTFTLDNRLYVDALPGAGKYYFLYYQRTAGPADQFELILDENGAITLNINTAGSIVVTLSTPNSTIAISTWYHIELVESGSNWWIFVDGVQKAYVSDADMAANYTGDVHIGYNGVSGAGYYLNGRLDEIRVSNVARHTGAFEIPSAAYGAATTRTYVYVGATRPLQGMKFYVETANTAAGAMNVEYWNGSSWASVASLTDNTESPAGTPLGQTGTVTFTSTAATAKVKAIDSVILYWYRVTISDCDDTATIYHVSVDAPFQSVKDLWDGFYRTAIKVLHYDGSTYQDSTTNVAEEDYSSVNTATYIDLNGLTTGTDYLVLGFEERQMGIVFAFVGGKINTTANTIMTVSYWNGDDWTTVGTIEDGTIESNKSFGKSGTVTWQPPTHNTEFKTTIASEIPLYYYKISFSQTLSATDIFLDYVGGITAPRNISGGWKFPFMFQQRPMMVNYEVGKQGNRVDYGSANTTEVHNGEDTSAGIGGPLYFGGNEDIMAATEIYNRFGASIYNVAVFCKKNETHLLNGYDPESWRIYQISSRIGCPAPLTMDTAEVGFGVAEAVRNIAVWLSYGGPVIFDGAVLIPFAMKVSNFFDKTKSECINYDAIENARGVIDSEHNEYNLLIPSGSGQTTINKWLCLDLVRKRWFEKKPVGTSAYPQDIFRVLDSDGVQYLYGLFDDGYMRNLENGATWDGEDIEQVIETPDMIPTNSMWDQTKIKKIKMATETISETAEVAVTYYKDGNSTGESLRAFTANGSNRHVRTTHKLDQISNAWAHKFKFSVSTGSTEKGVPFLGWGYTYETLREDA